jgi:hypothetical protein
MTVLLALLAMVVPATAVLHVLAASRQRRQTLSPHASALCALERLQSQHRHAP